MSDEIDQLAKRLTPAELDKIESNILNQIPLVKKLDEIGNKIVAALLIHAHTSCDASPDNAKILMENYQRTLKELEGGK